jgi:hypothetical protein
MVSSVHKAISGQEGKTYNSVVRRCLTKAEGVASLHVEEFPLEGCLSGSLEAKEPLQISSSVGACLLIMIVEDEPVVGFASRCRFVVGLNQEDFELDEVPALRPAHGIPLVVSRNGLFFHIVNHIHVHIAAQCHKMHDPPRSGEIAPSIGEEQQPMRILIIPR